MEQERNGQEAGLPTGKDVLQYGGQAVIEGVMMRSARYFAIACRKPNGEIVVQREEVDKSIIGKLKWLNKPFLRGTLALVDAMALGTRALAFASNVQLEAQQETEGKKEKGEEGKTEGNGPNINASSLQAEETALEASIVNGPPVAAPIQSMPKSGKINDIAIGGTIAFSFVFGIGLFVLLPTALTGMAQKLGIAGHASAHQDMRLNLLDGLIRMAIFFGYILLISRMAQIRRVFQFHGAEHKAINTLEAGLPLTRTNALAASRIHPRCGTSFIFIVLLINLIVFAVLPRPAFILTRFALHLAVVPLVAGIAYETIKFAGKFRRNPLVMAVFAPGMWSQYLTTREPDASQIEVALVALTSVMEAEGHLPARVREEERAHPEPVTA